MIVSYILKTLAEALVKPISLIILVFIGIVFYRQNKKISLMQKIIIGESLDTPIELTLSEIVIGIFGATLASFMMSYLGVVFEENSMISLIFLLSIILMLIKPRFVCFSYSGAFLGFLSIILKRLSIILKNPQIDILKINIISLMTLIAILHFVEGIMIILDGKRGSVPIFTNRDGKVFGGFVLKRYWILPVVVLFMLSPQSMYGINITVPKTWGMFNQVFSSKVFQTVLISAIAFYGVVGYESVTFTKTREEKVISSGMSVIIYSLLLFIFTELSKWSSRMQLFVVIFAPFAHESMIFMQKYYEVKNKAIYKSEDNGIMVLEVLPNSVAYNMGIRSGDLLVNINDKKISEEKDILDVLLNAPNYINLKIKKLSGEFKELQYDNIISKNSLGALLVPKTMPQNSKVMNINSKKFKDVLNKVKNKK